MPRELGFASTPVAICASDFPNEFWYLLALMAKPLGTLLGHLKIYVDISFARVAYNSIVTKSLSWLFSWLYSCLLFVLEICNNVGFVSSQFFPGAQTSKGRKACGELGKSQTNGKKIEAII